MPSRMGSRSVTWSRLAPLTIVGVAAACGLGAATGGGGGAAGTTAAPASAAAAWFEPRSGGLTTTFREGPEVFGLPTRNGGTYESITFAEGKELFNGSLAGRGLGPTFNAESCLACHLGHGGGTVPGGDGPDLTGGPLVTPGLLVRLSVPGAGPHGEPLDEPVYGGQIQDRAVPGGAALPEAAVEVRWAEVTGTYADGTPYRLRRPTVTLAGLALGPLAPGAMTSARLAPPVIGMGLLEAVPDDVIVAAADPDDADRDGISGRPNRVWDRGREERALGRFGWKAGQPNVDQQTEGALLGDLGVTSQLYPAADGSTELSITQAYPLIFYTKALAVPAARNTTDPVARRGAEQFAGAGCASCHTTTFTTGPAVISSMAEQVIHPYTDLLLHDMGPDLADGRPEYEASGTEWRTPPLWGLGRRKEVSGVLVLLHDGRARSIEEAILWHGGEAEAARERFRAMSRQDRDALLAFLGSL